MKIYFYCLMIFLVLTSFSINERNKDLYTESILQHLSEMENDTVYVLHDFKIELPAKVGKFYLVSIDENKIRNILDKKESFYAMKLLPLERKNNYVQIRIVDFLIEYMDETKNDIAFINTGSEIFKYKLKKNKYKLIYRKQFD